MDKVRNILVFAASVVAAAKVISEAVEKVIKDADVFSDKDPEPQN